MGSTLKHSVSEVLDLYLAFRKGRDDFQLAAHGTDVFREATACGGVSVDIIVG
jgi:hypothetical protein